MKLCIATSYDENYTEIGGICAATIRRYAEKFGYDHRVNRERLSDRPPSWDKIKVVERLFEEGYEYVLWVDADSLFVRFDRDIRDEIEEDKHLYCTILVQRFSEMPGVRLDVDFPSFGFFLIKNSPWSRQILDEMWNNTRHIDGAPKDNAAFLELLGYTHYLYRLGKHDPAHARANHPARNTRPHAIWRHVKVLDSIWNSMEGVPHVPSTANPIMKHYPAQPRDQRLFSMQDDYDRLVLRNPIEPVDEVHCEFDRPLHGDGWHATELTAEGVPFRWTGKPTATLRVPLRAGIDYAISFDLLDVLTVETWELFHLRVEGESLRLERRPRERGYTCSGVIPRHLVVEGALTRLQFCVEETRTPTEFSNTADERQLGIAVSRLDIKPI